MQSALLAIGSGLFFAMDVTGILQPADASHLDVPDVLAKFEGLYGMESFIAPIEDWRRSLSVVAHVPIVSGDSPAYCAASDDDYRAQKRVVNQENRGKRGR